MDALLQDPVATVIDDDEHHAEAVVGGGPERLVRVHCAPVPDQRHHRSAREGELHAERRGEPPADAAAPEAEEALGVLAAEELPEAASRGDRFLHDHGVGRQALGDGVDQGQRRDRLAAARGQRPLLQLGDRLGVAFVRVFEAAPRLGMGASSEAFPQGLGQLGERGLRVAHDRHLRGIVLSDLPGVHVQVDDRQAVGHGLDVRRERQREEVAADGEEQIVLLEEGAEVGGEAGDRALVERVGEGEVAPVGHPFQSDWRAEQLRHLDQLGEPAALGHRVARDDQRPLRRGQQVRRPLHRLARPADPRVHARGLAQLEVALGVQHVHGE